MPTKRKVVNGTLQEVPQVNDPGEFVSWTGPSYIEYQRSLEAYEAELARCAATAIPMSAELKARLQEGQEVVEGKDFQVERQFKGCKVQEWRPAVPMFTNNDYTTTGYELRWIAVPIPVPPGTTPAKQRFYEYGMSLGIKINDLQRLSLLTKEMDAELQPIPPGPAEDWKEALNKAAEEFADLKVDDMDTADRWKNDCAVFKTGAEWAKTFLQPPSQPSGREAEA